MLKSPVLCSNARCKKPLNLTSLKLVNLVIIFKSALGEMPPATGRIYCDQKCYDEMLAHVNKNVPPLEQIDILENKRIAETPITYRIVCKQRFTFKVG